MMLAKVCAVTTLINSPMGTWQACNHPLAAGTDAILRSGDSPRRVNTGLPAHWMFRDWAAEVFTRSHSTFTILDYQTLHRPTERVNKHLEKGLKQIYIGVCVAQAMPAALTALGIYCI